jgi:hypothetical protein
MAGTKGVSIKYREYTKTAVSAEYQSPKTSFIPPHLCIVAKCFLVHIFNILVQYSYPRTEKVQTKDKATHSEHMDHFPNSLELP